jgi:hypothetical protein
MDSEYVTRQDLQSTKQDLQNALAATEERIVDHLTEKIRDAQTEILRAFYNWARPLEARMKPIEDHAQRLAWLEERVAALERDKLMGGSH